MAPSQSRVQISWFDDEAGFVCVLWDVSRDTVDQLIGYLRQLYGAWPEGKPLRAVFDCSRPNIYLTPYMIDQVSGIFHLVRKLKGRVAVLVANDVTADAFRQYVERTFQNTVLSITFQFFEDDHRALAWVQSDLPG